MPTAHLSQCKPVCLFSPPHIRDVEIQQSCTGNTIFVGLGGSTAYTTQKPYGWAKSLTSIGCFVLGALFFSNFCRYFGPLRRSTLIHSFLIQSLMVIFTAAIIAGGIVDGKLPRVSQDIDWKQEIPIALLSFQSAGQMVGSRILSISEIPTLVVTSVLCDFASDPALMAPLTGNIKRNRRALGFFGILAGAVAGGWISRVTGEIHSVLWIAAGIKVFITASWVFWPKAETVVV